MEIKQIACLTYGFRKGILTNVITIRPIILFVICASMLVSCVHKNEGPKFETHKLAYALYKPINYDGSNSLYVDTTRIVEGQSNVPTDAHLAFTPDVIRCSIPIAVKNAIKTEGYDCVGLANVKVYNVQCGTHGAFYFACKVKGNPVYKKH